jgi:hypothetical protein
MTVLILNRPRPMLQLLAFLSGHDPVTAALSPYDCSDVA